MLLEISIITYNRCDKLKNTLDYICNSPLKNYKITINDNASTDDTIVLLKDISVKYPNIIINSNKCNIGASANLIRAYENAEADYIWIICDDDVYDFTRVDESISLLQSKKPDILIVGSQNGTESLDLKKSNNEYVNQDDLLIESGYFATFLPAAIISIKKIKELNFAHFYSLCNTNFPQLNWISKIYDNKWNVIISEKFHVWRPNLDHGLSSDLFHTNCYLQSAKTIINKKYRKKFSDRLIGNNLYKYFVFLSKKIIKDKINGRFKFNDLFFHFTLISSSRIITAMPTSIIIGTIPSFVLKVMFFKYRKKSGDFLKNQ